MKCGWHDGTVRASRCVIRCASCQPCACLVSSSGGLIRGGMRLQASRKRTKQKREELMTRQAAQRESGSERERPRDGSAAGQKRALA